MNLLDRLQQAWQSQSCKNLDINPDQLLKTVRLERQYYLWSDVFVISVLSLVGLLMLGSALRNLHRDWPWLIYSMCLAWVVAFMLFNQGRRRRHAARYDEPLLAHVEWAIKDIEYRSWQDRFMFVWYTLPIALGCMIPPTIIFGMEFHRTHDWNVLLGLLLTLGVFAAVFTFVHLVIRRGLRMASEKRRRELEALRTLRETLLDADDHTDRGD